MSLTTFNFEYVVSVGLALGGAYAVERFSPGMNPVIKFFVVPLFIAYITLKFINTLMPKVVQLADRVGAYVEDETLGEINSMGYMQIFPPIFAVFLIFVILVYNRNI